MRMRTERGLGGSATATEAEAEAETEPHPASEPRPEFDRQQLQGGTEAAVQGERV